MNITITRKHILFSIIKVQEQKKYIKVKWHGPIYDYGVCVGINSFVPNPGN